MTTRKCKPRPRTPFGERLAAARIRAGLTQTELGLKLGISQRAISNWEYRETSSPHPDQLVKLANILDITIEELICGDVSEIKKKPGPRGKLHRVFCEVADLTRTQQKDIVEVLELLVRNKQRKESN